MRKSRYNILLSLFALSFLCTSAEAKSDQFKWDYINVDIEIDENGDLFISEEHQYSFTQGHNEQWHARFRWFPMDKIDNIIDVEVYELAVNGQALPEPKILTHKIEKRKNQLWIWWWHELNPPETHTFLLKYRVIGGLHINKPMNGLYWEAVFKNRPAKIEETRITVHLPPPLRSKTNAELGDGIRPVSIQTSPDGSTVGFHIVREIGPMEPSLEIRVLFPHRILKIRKPKWQRPWGRFKGMWPDQPWVPLIILSVALFFGIKLTKSIVTGDWSNWDDTGVGVG